MKQIYIKTDMTEMPKGCADCDFADIKIENFKISMAFCRMHDCGVILHIKNRPNWCPLVEIKEADK